MGQKTTPDRRRERETEGNRSLRNAEKGERAKTVTPYGIRLFKNSRAPHPGFQKKRMKNQEYFSTTKRGQRLEREYNKGWDNGWESCNLRNQQMEDELREEAFVLVIPKPSPRFFLVTLAVFCILWGLRIF